ncbi:MAG: hypothetical protein AB1Z57_00825, partial [Acidimicrobiia bacterium]
MDVHQDPDADLVARMPRGGAALRPLRQWKLSEIDLQAQDLWDDSTEMTHRMVERPDTAAAPVDDHPIELEATGAAQTDDGHPQRHRV